MTELHLKKAFRNTHKHTHTLKHTHTQTHTYTYDKENMSPNVVREEVTISR